MFHVSERMGNEQTIDEQTIGKNIRTLRKAAGLTLTRTAEEADLTKSALSKIETGHSSPPIATLLRIARVLHVPLTRFFTTDQINPPHVLTRRGHAQDVPMRGSQFGYSYQALCLGKGDKRVEPFLLTIRPDDPEGTFHHEGQEFIYMLSGKMIFTVNNDELILQAGDSLYFDSHYLHRTRVIGREEARFLCIFI